MRTAHYVEPYTDHEHFGRVMLLPFGAWTPWHAGIADVYVTDADARFDPLCMDVVPDDRDLDALAREASRITSVDELYEALGPHHFEWKVSLARRLDGFTGELARVEAPLRHDRAEVHELEQQRAVIAAVRSQEVGGRVARAQGLEAGRDRECHPRRFEGDDARVGPSERRERERDEDGERCAHGGRVYSARGMAVPRSWSQRMG